jgi:hypothetical protein
MHFLFGVRKPAFSSFQLRDAGSVITSSRTVGREPGDKFRQSVERK